MFFSFYDIASALINEQQTKKVSFNNVVNVILIPSRLEYTAFSDEIWWSKVDYSNFFNSAKIEIDKSVHDYGTMQQGDNGASYFKVTNTGQEPLIISKCKPSCGCTIPVCPKQPILAGETKTIEIKYHDTVNIDSC